jgi:hypothetical protein
MSFEMLPTQMIKDSACRSLPYLHSFVEISSASCIKLIGGGEELTGILPFPEYVI